MQKKSFARNVSVLVGGSACAQILMVAAAPVLTRLFLPSDFGIFAVFGSLLALFTVVASGRYEMAIALPESEKDAFNILVLSFICLFFSLIVSVVVVVFWGKNVSEFLNTPALESCLWLLPIGVFFMGSYQVLNKWAVREKNFTVIARTRIWQAFGTLTIQMVGAKFGAVALVGGQSVGQGIGLLKLSSLILKKEKADKITFSEITSVAKRYKEFPLYSTWTGFFNTASLHFAPVLFVSIFGSSVAGLYALTHRILSMPANLIGNAIGSVFLSEAPDAYRRAVLNQLVEKLHFRLVVAGVLPLAIILFFGPWLFSMVFGEDWRQAGIYAQWMAPWLYAQFKWTPLSTVAVVLELQKQLLFSDLMLLTVRLGSVIVFWFFSQSPLFTIAAFSIVSAFSYILRMAWFLSKADSAYKFIVCFDLFVLGFCVAYIVLS